MSIAKVRGVNINYKVIGDHGPWVALSPGGRRDISGIERIAKEVAELGHRVAIFDRRNCGASDVVIDGKESEYEIWADDIHELLSQLGALPGLRRRQFVGLPHFATIRAAPSAIGSRSIALARNRRALRLRAPGREYYGQYIEAAEKGGMAAVCAMEHWKERIEARPQNRDALMEMKPEQFIEVMSHWREYFSEGADLPVIGATRKSSVDQSSACIIPGNDNTHGRQNRRKPWSARCKKAKCILVPETLRRASQPKRGMG